jgi:hypothetical protein
LSLEYFEGPAGSGKTYNLIEALKRYLATHPLDDNEAVLGITYMHGSRRRMHSALSKVSSVRGRFLASTVDSLVHSVVHRWRSLAMEIDPGLEFGGLSPHFDRICQAGATLLSRPMVAQWLVRRYPVLLVDELQDCRGYRLAVLKALEPHCHIIAAADGFQDLDSTGTCEAMEWLETSGGSKTILTGSKRTALRAILEPANTLRAGGDCGESLGYRLSAARNANVGAAAVARGLFFNGCKDVVILTTTGPEKSSFVKNVVQRLIAKEIAVTIKAKKKENLGPYSIVWEASDEAEREALLGRLEFDVGGHVHVDDLMGVLDSDQGVGRDLLDWVVVQGRKKGTERFSRETLSAAANRLLHSRRAFLPDRPSGVIRAMTINQAKNREFDGVIVLWPLATGGGIEAHRRKLYNAITRAKRWVNVVMQESIDEPRVGKPPFSKASKAT